MRAGTGRLIEIDAKSAPRATAIRHIEAKSLLASEQGRPDVPASARCSTQSVSGRRVGARRVANGLAMGLDPDKAKRCDIAAQ